MKQLIILLVVFLNCSYLSAQWKPAGERIKTEWATKIDVENVLPEYPPPHYGTSGLGEPERVVELRHNSGRGRRLLKNMRDRFWFLLR